MRYGELVLGERGEIFEQSPVLGRECPRLLIKNAKCARLESVHVQGAAGVETDLRVSDYHWIVGEALVFERVLHVEDVVKEDRVCAKRNVPGGLAYSKTLN